MSTDTTLPLAGSGAIPAEAKIAGLRTRLVSRLTGLTVNQLAYWHRSGLLAAHLRPGARGTPRLYSWVDYLQIRVASSLHENDVPTRRIREAVEFLDEYFPDWYLIPVQSSEGHVIAMPDAFDSPLAIRQRQHLLTWPDALSPYAGSTARALNAIRAEGPLGRLKRFGKFVDMNPSVNLAQPTLRGTSLETAFVAEATKAYGESTVVALYALEPPALRRALQFQEAVA